MNTTPDNSPDPAEDKLAELLAKAGPRLTPPAKLQTEVRAAVHAEWRHLTQGRRQQQQRRWLAAAAMLLVTVGGGWLALRMSADVAAPSAPAALLATITHGQPLLNGTASNLSIRSGDVLSTQSAAARVELHSGISVRIGRNTQLRWIDADELQLQQGTLYIDSHGDTAALTVHTAHGDVSHLGTRYLVDSDAQQLHVAVREGKVGIHSDSTAVTVDALQQVYLLDGGQVQRSDLNMSDALWQWADELAQPFALENRSVAEFLQWVSQETGYELHYANNAVERAASDTLLHGGQTSQTPLQALRVVLAATDFRVEMQDRQLVITQAR